MLSSDGVEITEEHVGKRVIYTDRSGKEHLGSLRGVIPVAGMVDFDRDESVRSKFYVPCDTIRFVLDASDAA